MHASIREVARTFSHCGGRTDASETLALLLSMPVLHSYDASHGLNYLFCYLLHDPRLHHALHMLFMTDIALHPVLYGTLLTLSHYFRQRLQRYSHTFVRFPCTS